MEIRNIIKNNKTGEVLSDKVMEIADDELDAVTGGTAMPKGYGQNADGRFKPISRDEKFQTTGRGK